MGLSFRIFNEDDVERYTPIMKRAFDEDSKMHRNGEEGGPPGYDNGDYLRQSFLDKYSKSFSVYKDDTPIGAANLLINNIFEGWLENIFIDYDYWSKGFGQIIWDYIEHKFTNVNVWRLQTPGYSRRNHNFYVNKCGFKIIRIINPNKKNRPYPGYYIFEKYINDKIIDIEAVMARRNQI
jgi:hypothetical protein